MRFQKDERVRKGMKVQMGGRPRKGPMAGMFHRYQLGEKRHRDQKM